MDDARELARRIAAEGPAAFEGVVRAVSPRLFRIAARLLCRPDEAADAVQESFLRAFDALREGRYDERARMEAWLVTIVTRVSLDMLRGRKVRERGADPVDPERLAWAEATDEQVGALLALGRWLEGLPPDQRAAVVLRFLEGMTSAEVASALGISEGAVEQRVLRARATLKKRMNDGT